MINTPKSYLTSSWKFFGAPNERLIVFYLMFIFCEHIHSLERMSELFSHPWFPSSMTFETENAYAISYFTILASLYKSFGLFHHLFSVEIPAINTSADTNSFLCQPIKQRVWPLSYVVKGKNASLIVLYSCLHKSCPTQRKQIRKRGATMNGIIRIFWWLSP